MRYLAILDPFTRAADVRDGLARAIKEQFDAVLLPPVWIPRAAATLRGSGVRIAVTVSFPHGTAKPTLKAIEATSSIKDGADEVFIVAHQPLLLEPTHAAARNELMEIVRAARATRRDVAVHVIFDAPLLMTLAPQAIANACLAIRESGGDGVVSASGIAGEAHTTAATIAAIRSHAEGLAVMAMGAADVDCGADRFVISDTVS